MSAVSTSAHFFGLELSGVSRDLLIAWRRMLGWPLFAWLWPKLPVRLWLLGGEAVLSLDASARCICNPGRTLAARYEAVQLPERLLLRSTLQLPRLPTHELQEALSLHVVSLSPFVASDLVWVHEPDTSSARSDSLLGVHLVLASRKQISQYIMQMPVLTQPDRAEAWVPRAVGQGHLVMPGFGETTRIRHSLAWRWVSAVLLGVVLALLAAIAVTPSVQFFLRLQQAHQSMASLQQKAAPAVKQREALVHTTDQLANLMEIIGKPVAPLHVLKLVTDALPDDTSLLGLQLQGAKVTLTGQTANAAVLMKQLGATPGLRDVTAPTPATKPLGAPREQFTIEFTLDAVQNTPAK